MLAGVTAILSKFLIRVNNKHIFNPANFGIVLVLLTTNSAWLSPGQWGHIFWIVLLFLCIGGYITYKVGSLDAVLAFGTCYASGIILRGLALGDPTAVTLYKLESGMMILYIFFMISDPKTLPNARITRLIYGGCLAMLALIFKFQYLITYDLIYALFILSPFVPILDKIKPEVSYQWKFIKPSF